MCLGTQNYELAAAKCNASQEPTGTIDGSTNYSTQHSTKQTSYSNAIYEVSNNFIMCSYITTYNATCINCHIFLFYRIRLLIMKPRLAFLVMKTTKNLIMRLLI